jgi:preprotein translocase subunit SecE
MAGGREVIDDPEVGRPEPEPRHEPPALPPNAGAVFHRVAVVVALVAAFCLAATVYFLPTETSFLWKQIGGFGKYVNVMLPIGAALFGVMAWAVLTKLAPRLKYEKPRQGTWARISAYVGVGAMALFAGVAFFGIPAYTSAWFGGQFGIWQIELFGKLFTLRPIFFPAAALFLGALIGFHLFVNRPKATEFLIETQGEMRKVSWPARKEWIGSTMVVLVLVAILSTFLFFVDEALSKLLARLGIGF